MELGLELIRTNGRQKKQITGTVVRPLEPSDLLQLQEERGVQKPPSSVRRLSDRHRNLARLLAAGKDNVVAAAITGYSEAYISNLRRDPAFKNLMSLYEQGQDEEFQKAAEMLSGLAVDAIDAIRDRLEETPEDIPTSQLLEIAKFAADRSGNGPQSRTTNVNVHIGSAERLEAARKRLEAARNPIIDITPTESKDG